MRRAAVLLSALAALAGCKDILGIQELTPAAAGPDAGVHAVPSACPIGFHVWSDEQADLMMASMDGTERVTFASGEGDQRDPAWSPDGQRIAFSTGLGRFGQLQVYTPATGATLGLGGTMHELFPAWAPDESALAFVAFDEGEMLDQLYVVNVDGSGVRRILRETGNVSHPQWSPAGDRIAYQARDPGATDARVMMVDPDGNNAAEIGRVTYDGRGLSWSPDGARVALAFDNTVVVANADGTDPQVIASDSVDEPVAWSPDGERIAYTTVDGVLTLIRPDGSHRQALTSERYNTRPAWSPDGRALAFLSYGSGDTRSVHVIDVFGRNRTPLYESAVDHPEAPVWSTGCDTGLGDTVALASDQGEPTAVVTDATHVYWTNAATNKVMRAARSGGAAELVADTEPGPRPLVMAGAFLYWRSDVGSLWRATKTGTNLSEELLGAGVEGSQLAADAEHVYFGRNGSLSRYRLSDGQIDALVADAGGVHGVAVDDTHVYWSTYGDDPSAGDTGTIRRVAKAGGSATTLATGQAQPFAVAVAGGQVYWGTQAWGTDAPRPGGATLMRAEADGSNPVALISGATDCSGRIVVTDTEVWTTCAGQLQSVPRDTDGSIAPAKAGFPEYTAGFAVEGQWIFAALPGDGRVLQALQ